MSLPIGMNHVNFKLYTKFKDYQVMHKLNTVLYIIHLANGLKQPGSHLTLSRLT